MAEGITGWRLHVGVIFPTPVPPRAVLEAGLASAVLSPDKIAGRIASRTGERRACR